MRIALTLLMILLLPGSLSAQRGRGRAGAGVGAGQGARMNRMALERQIMQRFVEQSSREMGLGQAERGRFAEILQRGAEQRREFAQRGANLRQQLMEAIRDPATSDARFSEILGEIARLREEEHALWRADQEAMGEMFTPRQRALYTARWLRLQEVIRDVMNQRQGGTTRGNGLQSPIGNGIGQNPPVGPPLVDPLAMAPGFRLGLPLLTQGGR